MVITQRYSCRRKHINNIMRIVYFICQWGNDTFLTCFFSIFQFIHYVMNANFRAVLRSSLEQSSGLRLKVGIHVFPKQLSFIMLKL